MNEHLKNAKTIMVRCPNWVGDVVMAAPAFQCLRDNFPEAKIIACIRKYAQGVISDSPWFDEIIACDDKSLSGLRQTGKAIAQYRPEAAILFTNSTRSLLSAKLGGAKKVFAYQRGVHSWFINGPKPIVQEGKFLPMPMQRYYLDLLRWLELDVPDDPQPSLGISPQLQKQADALFQKYGITDNDFVIGLNPGAKFGSSKCWPTEHFARLAELLQAERKCKIMLLVGPGEDPIAEAIVKDSSADVINTGPDKVDLALLKPVVKRCNLMITNDTGPRHYAVAFNLPTVVIMGPTDRRWTDCNLDKTTIVQESIDCIPCHLKTCPKQHECMTMIKPEKVALAAAELLERTSAS